MLAACCDDVLCVILLFCALPTVNKSVTLVNEATAFNLTALNVDADYMFWMFSITRQGRSELSSKAAFIRTSSSCKLRQLVVSLHIEHVCIFAVFLYSRFLICYTAHQQQALPAFSPPRKDMPKH